jgi:CxxC motif-containing protein (DUF1111 family)
MLPLVRPLRYVLPVRSFAPGTVLVVSLPALLLACGEGRSGSASEAASAPAPAPGLALVAEDPSDAPLEGLTPAELARFEDGDARFELPFREAQGLGPLYIHRACTSCHEDDARGPGAVRRIARLGPDAPPLPHGDVVRPRATAGATTPLLAPSHPLLREELRLPPAVFARGLLEAIPDATLLAWEAAQARRDDGVRGRAARLPFEAGLAAAGPAAAGPFGEAAPVLGRFGHKARAATLEAFVADALLGDMGLTSPARPDELPNPDGLRDDLRPGVDVRAEEIALLADYVRLLAIPRRPAPDPELTTTGAALFARVGCDACHVPEARTRADHPVAALRDVPVALYTDLLLHDMGEGLADGIPEGAAGPRDWRTAPLVGLRHLRALLHDGRASTVREAIAAHASEGSEANAAVARWEALAEPAQEALLRFVEAL